MENMPHNRFCLTAAMICAVENLRDNDTIATDAKFEQMATGVNFVGIAVGYLNDGLTTCRCAMTGGPGTGYDTLLPWVHLGRQVSVTSKSILCGGDDSTEIIQERSEVTCPVCVILIEAGGKLPVAK